MRQQIPWGWLVAILLLTFILGVRGLDTDPIWGDEFRSIYDSGGTVYGPLTTAEVWQRVATRNPWHTPGFFMLLNGWGRLTGWEPPALRVFALLAAVLAVAWTYRLGRDLASRSVGLYAAAILGTSTLFVHYAHELRMYSLIALLTVATITLYFRALHARGRVHPLVWVGLLLGALGLLYSHYFAALPLGAVGLYHLLFAPKNRRWLALAGLFALAGILFLPWLGALQAGLALAAEREGGSALTSRETVDLLVVLFSGGQGWLLALTAALAFAGALLRPRRWRVWFFPLASLGLIIAANTVVPIMDESRVRYLISLWPLVALVMGLGVASVARLRFAAPLLAVVWIAAGMNATLDGRLLRDLDGVGYTYPLHTVARSLQGHAQPGDFIIHYLPDDLFAWMYTRNVEFYFRELDVGWHVVEKRVNAEQQTEVQTAALSDAAASDRLWLVYPSNPAPSTIGSFQTRLAQDYAQCGRLDERASVQLTLYARSPVCCSPDAADDPALITYPQGLMLTAAAPLEPPQGGTLTVHAGWAGGDRVPYVYSIALHVVDASGQLVAQTDVGYPLESFSCAPLTVPVGDLSPGRYEVLVIVYRWETGERLTGRRRSGEQAERLLLDSFTIFPP